MVGKKRKNSNKYDNKRKKRKSKGKKEGYYKNNDLIDDDFIDDDNENKIILNFQNLLNNEEGVKKDNEEDIYLKTLNKNEIKKIKKIEDEINENKEQTIPLKYKILNMNIDNEKKKILLKKAEKFKSLSPNDQEYNKIKLYMEGLFNIPFEKYIDIPIDKNQTNKIKLFFKKLKNDLDNCILGQENAKNKLLQIIGKKINNPKSYGNIIGLYGPPGVGKTSLIKNGLAKGINLPFKLIPLGGVTNVESIKGFEYTYVGSKWGKISNCLMETKCMNPIIFFDELDKIGNTENSKEVINSLIHITDNTQNDTFYDNFFSNIPLDISKIIFIFSFNDIKKIDPILLDRMTVVKMDGFNTDDKINIAKNYSLKKVCKDIGFNIKYISINEEVIRVIINTYCPEKGVRKLEKCLETIILKLNLYYMTKGYIKLGNDINIEESPTYTINVETAIKILDPVYRKDDMQHMVKMMYS